ncbi:MAG: hypothetical protein JW828_16125 [Sedimentisphaerales bacterium]|nr:hypothetical protein [Sedimentisphaerales bacterium]
MMDRSGQKTETERVARGWGKKAFRRAGMILGWFLMTASGCTVVKPMVPDTGHYYINPQAEFSAIGKVVVFEPVCHAGPSDLGLELGDSVCRALQKKHLFNVIMLARSDPAWSALSLDNESFSLEQMRQIRHSLNADAIVLGRVGDYQPYPHLLIGLHLKMLDLRNGHLVWGMEQIWDSSDKTVQQRMKAYHQNQLGKSFEPLYWQMLTTSPKAFHKFVSYEVSQTLPDASQILRMRPATAQSRSPGAIRQASHIKKAVPLRQESRPVPIKPVLLVPLEKTQNSEVNLSGQ